ncbi:hypothetical protein DV737_g313, partial [Chaetothyriales sp. CBS 132003]
MSTNGSEDVSIEDVEDESFAIVEELQLGGEKKVKVLPGASSHAASFQVMNEDHTMGNALRYFINKKSAFTAKTNSSEKKNARPTNCASSPDVEFCGYTIPHPAEPKMSIRIQTWEDSKTSAFDALRKGLQDMVEACDVVSATFTHARDAFGPPGRDRPREREQDDG